jgi:hypothetical protein
MPHNPPSPNEMKLQSKTRWLMVRKPDIAIERRAEPVKLSLDEAVNWIGTNKPILWVGSIFSVPEPSGFPSGYAISRSIFNLIFPPTSGISDAERENMIASLIPKWPLEALFDEFELLNFDLAGSLLTFFAKHDQDAEPNALHHAVTQYYDRGLSRSPLCVTTNWDSLLEKAFRSNGYTVTIGGPDEMPSDDFGKGDSAKKAISVYHPHGSFETKDVVCSYVQEQQQLTLPIQPFSEPTLFLGYSGYEPSLYRHLEHTAGQLWCIRDESDFEIPSKRRLLCRPNTFVYVGDLQELLKGLDVLPQPVMLQSNHLALNGALPMKVVDVIRSSMASRLEPRFCFDPLLETLYNFYDEPEATFRYSATIRAFENHIRDRVAHTGVPLALMAASRFRDHEQLWIDLLAYLLRFSQQVRDEIIDSLLKHANEARESHTSERSDGINQYLAITQARTRCYKSFLRRPEREDDDVKDFMLNNWAPQNLGDLALAGELTELAAFACLRDDESLRAKCYFDTAATYYYLTGLWNAGRLCEWASEHLDTLKHGEIQTLFMPADASQSRP